MRNRVEFEEKVRARLRRHLYVKIFKILYIEFLVLLLSVQKFLDKQNWWARFCSAAFAGVFS